MVEINRLSSDDYKEPATFQEVSGQLGPYKNFLKDIKIYKGDEKE